MGKDKVDDWLRNTWRRDLEANAKEKGHDREHLEQLAQDQNAWRPVPQESEEGVD